MFTLTLKEDLMPELEKRVKELIHHKVEIGMFIEQGEHSESGFDYVALFKYLSDGDPSRNMPPRSPLQVVAALNDLKRSGLKQDVKKYLTNLKTKPSIKVDDIMENVGMYYRGKVRDVFGDQSRLAPKAESTKAISQSPNTPLIETGELAKKVAYRVDEGDIKEIGR